MSIKWQALGTSLSTCPCVTSSTAHASTTCATGKHHKPTPTASSMPQSKRRPLHQGFQTVPRHVLLLQPCCHRARLRPGHRHEDRHRPTQTPKTLTTSPTFTASTSLHTLSTTSNIRLVDNRSYYRWGNSQLPPSILPRRHLPRTRVAARLASGLPRASSRLVACPSAAPKTPHRSYSAQTSARTAGAPPSASTLNRERSQC